MGEKVEIAEIRLQKHPYLGCGEMETFRMSVSRSQGHREGWGPRGSTLDGLEAVPHPWNRARENRRRAEPWAVPLAHAGGTEVEEEVTAKLCFMCSRPACGLL